MDNTSPARKNNGLMLTVIAALIVGVVGFGGGMMFQKSKDSLKNVSAANLQAKLKSLGFAGIGTGGNGGTQNTNGMRTFGGGGFGGGGFGGRNGGGFVNGQIVSADSQSVTVKEANGSTIIVYYSGSTTIMKSVTGATTDLTVGQTITSSGTANSDGSVAATTIQIRPAGSATPPSQAPGQ